MSVTELVKLFQSIIHRHLQEILLNLVHYLGQQEKSLNKEKTLEEKKLLSILYIGIYWSV